MLVSSVFFLIEIKNKIKYSAEIIVENYRQITADNSILRTGL